MAKSRDQLKTARKNRRARHNAENKTLKNRSKWYESPRTKRRFTRKENINRRPTLKSDIQPGQILILLAGRFRGRRVVFLKQLDSGLLLVTGPYKINGVPLKRVNKAYVLATRTRINLDNIPSLNKIYDDNFKRVTLPKDKDTDSVIITVERKEITARVTDERRNNQNLVDTEVLKAIRNVNYIRNYLQFKFTLQNRQSPHNMVF